MNFVDGQLHLANRPTDRMTGKRQRHSLAAPIIAASAPLLATSPLPLRRETVVEKESRIAFECVEVAVFRERVRCANDVSAPIAAALDSPRVEQLQILSAL